MTATKIKIETNQIMSDFKMHLEIETNNRVLFSRPFGTEKSPFLKDFPVYF